VEGNRSRVANDRNCVVKGEMKMLLIKMKSGKNYKISVGENLSFKQQVDRVLATPISFVHGYYVNNDIAINVSEIEVIEKAD
jgi:dTDP-4-dehydrorhamnose 3,5-epimerase-like enzyme